MRSLKVTKTILYKFKRQFGQRIQVFQAGDQETRNYQTGVMLRTYTITNVERAIVMPARLVRDIAWIQLNRELGFFDFSTKVIIIDRADFAGTLDLNDFINFNDQRWEIKEITDTEDSRAYLLIVEAMSTLRAAPQGKLVNDLNFGQIVTFVRNAAI